MVELKRINATSEFKMIFWFRKARGADVVFDHAIDVTLEGKLPDGVEGRTTIKMANIVGIMTMKGIVVGSRYKQKGCLRYSQFGFVLQVWTVCCSRGNLRPFIDHGLVKEAIESIHEKFRSREAEGPSWVADFMEAADELGNRLGHKPIFRSSAS